ncbi:phage terminase small subunit [Paenibacillus amylolyticus]|uniref:phage terminase small subunit n=1 Tax=Paenibacillus amylolyticus TaxID=1451 RepID=UPI00249C13A0|nr:phage terminase small subunit [Paenibacillus amylolyticus]WFA86497.1 phage terminase small subunit [Paenibacillus amylolyticus]
MSRKQNPNRKKAYKIWKDSGGAMKPKEIAEKLGITPESVRVWKSLDQWEGKMANAKPGAPRGNQNARGNRGGKGGPPGNQKAVTHGLFRKFEPQDPEYLEILDLAQQMDPVDIIWYDITKGFQRIIWAQRIFFVNDKDDMTKELKRERPGEYGDEYEWEIQFAGDKYANYIKSEAIVMREIRGAIKQFMAISHENDERRLKLDQMQAKIDKTRLEIEKLKNGDGDTEDDLIEDWVNSVESSI